MKKLLIILLAAVMAFGMAVFAACADKPAEEPDNPNNPGTEQPADPDQPVTEEQMRAKLAEFKTYLTTDHESFSVSSEMFVTDPEDGDSSVKVSVDVTKTKIRAAFGMTDDDGEYNGDIYYVYDETNELWYEVGVNGDGTVEKPELLFVNATSVDYVVDNIIDARVTTVADLLSVMDDAVFQDGALVYVDGNGMMKLSFGDGEYALEISMSGEGASLSIKLTFRSTASDFTVPTAVTEAIGAISPEAIVVAKYLNEFEKSSANVTVAESGGGMTTETKKGFIGGGEYSLYSKDNQYSTVKIGESFVHIEQSGEDNLRVRENYSSSDTETVRGMLYAEQIFSFISRYDGTPLLCLKEGSNGKIVTLNEEGRQTYATNGITELEIDYSTDGTIVMTIGKVDIGGGSETVFTTVVTLTNIGQSVTPDYAPSVAYVRARVFDNVYYRTTETGGEKYAVAAQVFGYDEIVDIKKMIAVGNDAYTVTAISPYLLENNRSAVAVAVPDSVTEPNNFADKGIVYKIYYKAPELPEGTVFASNKTVLVYLYSGTAPTGNGFFWHYADDNTIKEYDSVNLFTITFHGADDEIYKLNVTEDGFIMGAVQNFYGSDETSFVGWYYDKDTWENEFDPDDVGKVTADFDVYARFEKTYRVYFETEYGFVSNSGNRYFVIENEPVPQNSGYIYEFGGWYYDEAYTQKVTFPLTLTEDVTLYAKWTQAEYGYATIPDTDGTTIAYALVAYNGDGKDVVIPETYNGLPVSTIGIDCFNGVEDKILSLTILGNIGNLGDLTSGAFENLTNLVKVTIGRGITDIGGEIAHYEENGTLSESNIFQNCHNIKEVRILSPELKTAVESGKGYTFGGLLRHKNNYSGMDILYNVTDASNIEQDGCYVYRTERNRKWLIKYLPDLAENKENPVIPSRHNGVEIYGIDSYAFANYTKLASVAFGSIRFINDHAFYNTGILGVEIPNSVTDVRDYAFGGCPKLLTVTIGTYADTITTEAFSESYNLVEVINHSIKMTITDPRYIGIANALVVKNDENATSSLVGGENGCVTLSVPGENEGDVQVYLAAYSVDPDAAPASLEIPAGVTHIRDGVFSGDDIAAYTGLKEVRLPATLEYIGAYAFCRSGLTSVTIPAGVTGIGDYAFADTAVTEIIMLSSGKTTVGAHAFDAPTLRRVAAEGIMVNVSADTFGSAFDGYTKKDGCYYVGNSNNPYLILVKADNQRSYTLPGGVKQIANYAFDGCDKLASIDIPDAVEHIGAFAFNQCTSLYRVKLGSGVKTIEGCAFDGCRKLYEVVNASSLTITAGEIANNGGVAENALNVIAADGTSILTKTEDGFVFMKRTLGVESSGSTVDTELYFLIAYDGEGGEITLPANFNGNKYRVSNFAFTGRTDVTRITIGKDSIAPEQLRVNGAPLYSFACNSFWLDNSTRLTIDFNGTQAEWGAISKYDYSDGTGTWYGTTGITVTCTDGTIEL